MQTLFQMNLHYFYLMLIITEPYIKLYTSMWPMSDQTGGLLGSSLLTRGVTSTDHKL